VSQPALARWLEKGEIATVLTPEGRREVPLRELLDLYEEVEQARREGAQRALARVIADRHRRSEQAIDIDRLLPRTRRRGHRAAEKHALAYHRLLAERVDEDVVERARRRLARWRQGGRIHPRWADEWERVLELPLPQVAQAISADTTQARELRQTSPFAGELNEQERRRLTRAVEERV
jgi:hypothetical protein